MTKKRFEVIKSEITGLYVPIDNNKEFVFEGVEKASTILKLTGLLNAQHEENLELKHDNKRLVKFIMSKGYNLKDYLDWLKEEVFE